MREAKERQWPGPLPHHVELLAALVGDHDGQLRHREQEAAVQRRKDDNPIWQLGNASEKRPSRRGGGALGGPSSVLTAAIPMDNLYCGCRLTRPPARSHAPGPDSARSSLTACPAQQPEAIIVVRNQRDDVQVALDRVATSLWGRPGRAGTAQPKRWHQPQPEVIRATGQGECC